MKTPLFAAAAALALAACSAPTSDDAISETSANETTSTVTTTVDVTVDLTKDAANLKCRLMKGGYIFFDFQDHSYFSFGANSISACNVQLEAFKASPIKHGTITKEHGSATIRWTLDLEGRRFSSFSPAADDRGLVLTTKSQVDLATGTDLTDVKCRMIKGAALFVTFGGDEFMGFVGDPAVLCGQALDSFNQSSRHTGELSVRTYETHVLKTLVLDDGEWQLTSWPGEGDK